jgi:lipopolysaccharide cholinephosphotransferase
MVDMRDELGSRGVPVFLNFGTLLGALREKGFIAHDDDADMEIYERDEETFLSCLPVLEAKGLVMFGKVPEKRLYKFRRGGEQLDLFIAHEKRSLFGRSWDLDNTVSAAARHLDSLEEIDFLGERFKVPADPYGLVRHLYGKTWNVPLANRPARVYWSFRFRKALDNPGKILFYARRFFTKRLGWARLARKG